MNNEPIKKMYENHLVNQQDICHSIMLKIEAQNVKKPRRSNIKSILAACLTLVIIVGAGSGYAVWAEAKEYKNAVAFFDEYDLPTEGLSRTDIKAVYKDITLKTFSYEKTIEILNTFSAELYSVDLGTKNQQDLENLWNYRNALNSSSSINTNGIHYVIGDSEEPINELFKKTSIKKYDGQTLLWSSTVEHSLYCEESNVITSPDGTILYGIATEQNSQWYGIVMMFDNNGKLLWEKVSEYSNSEFSAGLLDDGKIVVFGKKYSDFNYKRNWIFLYNVYDMQGNLLKSTQRELGEYSNVSAAVKISDYYLVKFGGFNPSNARQESELICVSKEGEFIDKYSYSQDGKNYFIRDIYSYGGKVYLSALLPNIESSVFDQKFSELMAEQYEMEEEHAWEFNQPAKMPEEYNKRLRNLFIEQYSAVLLVCDEKGRISTAYTAPNSRGGTFSLSSGNTLQWQVLRVDDVKCVPPMLSSRRVDIAATEFCFEFNENGKLLKKAETGPASLFY